MDAGKNKLHVVAYEVNKGEPKKVIGFGTVSADGRSVAFDPESAPAFEARTDGKRAVIEQTNGYSASDQIGKVGPGRCFTFDDKHIEQKRGEKYYSAKVRFFVDGKAWSPPAGSRDRFTRGS